MLLIFILAGGASAYYYFGVLPYKSVSLVDDIKVNKNQNDTSSMNGDSGDDIKIDREFLSLIFGARYYGEGCDEKFVHEDPNELIRYENSEKGFSFDVPFNQSWGNESYQVNPFDEFNDTVIFGNISVFEGCSWVRNYYLSVLPAKSADEVIQTIKAEGDELTTIDGEIEINGLKVVKYSKAGLCDYPILQVVGDNYNYELSTICGGSFEDLEAILSTMEITQSNIPIDEELSDKTNNSLKTISEIKQIQTALELFFAYPMSPIGGNRLGIDAICLTENGFGQAPDQCLSPYVKELNIHHLSPEKDYHYYICGEDKYIIEFDLEVDTEGFLAGLNYASQDGIGNSRRIPANCLDEDNDGLSNYFESKYNTSINNPDTDGDGFLDGGEVMNGFNPNGSGTL